MITLKTACPLDCFDACGVVAEVEGDRILRIRGDADHPITRGALCRKVNHFLENRQYSPERITRPLVRADGRFATPSGRFVFPDRFRDEPVLGSAEFPLHLIAQATTDAVNSQMPEADQGAPLEATLSPEAAAGAGVADGDLAALVSPRGRLEVRVRLDPALRPDTVVLPKGGWHKRWHKHGRNMNVLVAPRYTEGTGAAFNQNFVRLERVPTARA